MTAARSSSLRVLATLILCLGVVAVFGSGLWAPPLGAQSAGQPQQLETAPVTIETASGAVHVFIAEIADEGPERNRGLMFRERLGRDEGMLFIYERPTEAGFWMRNTLIPLDMVFVAPGGRIIHVHENAIPGDETGISSQGVVRSVLEIRGGLARRLGIAPGDFLSSPALAPYGD